MSRHASPPRSIVDAFIALGLAEADAWRCVHLMQGHPSLVLLQMRRRDDEPPPPVPALDEDHVAAALERGAAWATLEDGGWQYLRRVDWSLGDLLELQEDLARLSSLDFE